MGRVTIHVPDSMLSALDQEAHNRSISRSQAAATAIESFISGNGQATHNELSETHNKLSASEQEVMRLSQELSKLHNQIAEKDKALESSSSEVMRLQEEVKRVVMLQEEVDDLKERYKQLATENTGRWEETKALKNENTKLEGLLDESQKTIQHLKDDLLKRQSETDQLARAREELASARMEASKLNETVALKNDEAAFLRGHISQLTQSISQFALKPSEEEIRKKGWWQFWKQS
jgi:chromosome segregation ATPase